MIILRTIVVAVLLLSPLATSPVLAIEFGNNSSEWANDGECDDPRFAGPGMADILLDEDIGRDANDCRYLLNKGNIYLLSGGGKASPVVPGSGKNTGDLFGNNSSEWANDGECDDPRFAGPGMATVLLDEDIGRDANDCRSLYNSGSIFLLSEGGKASPVVPGGGKTVGNQFGNNSSEWAFDGECDDPRFFGSGMAAVLLNEDIGRDANDCRALYNAGAINWR